MGERTKLSVATPGKESLRTTVPMSILKHYRLKAGDFLEWDLEARDNNIILVVKPIKEPSTGKVGIDKLEETISS
jgi:bifunctional DNA-binding transcriptional regulator/antitoxin component of YhaV-PrlF toxin-antitoxin module